MPWTPDLPIRSQPRATVEQAEQALAYVRVARPDDVTAYIRELWRLAPEVALDPAILYAQAVEETAGFASRAWATRLNPAGIGITDGGDYGYRWENGADAARAHVVHLDVYVNGVSRSPVSGDVLAPYYPLDPRRDAVIAAGWAGTVRTIRDLTGKWATDPQYHEKIVRWLTTLFGEPPEGATMAENVVFGRVPKPVWVNQYVEKPAGHGYGDYGPRRFRGIVLHRMAGTLLGTRSHFRATSGHGLDALTDWGIGGALDGDLDGVIDRYNDPDGRRSPWASGPAISPDGKLLVNGDAVDWYRKYALSDPAGVNIFNRDTEAIELSGQYDTPVTEKQYRALVQLIAWRLDSKMKLPWYVWPKNHDGVQAILWHGEIMGWTKPCPGQVVIDLTDRLINDVRDYLRRYQEQATEMPQPQPPAQSPRPARPEDDPEVLKSWFGRLIVDGRTLTYSPKAAENPASISAIWRAHGEATGSYPRIAGYSELPDGTRVYEFDGGWRIIDPAGPAKPRPAGGGRP